MDLKMIIVNDKPVGIKATHPVVTIDYKMWGLANTRPEITRLVTEIKEVSGGDLTKYIAKLRQVADLDGYTTVIKKHVQHYCGEDYAAPTLLWLRLEREDRINNGVGGEHISATFDINDGKLSHASAQELQFAFYDEQRSVLATIPNETNFKAVLMPLRS